MDNKLRKQIEGIGFELNATTYDLNIENTGFMICNTEDWLKIWSVHIGRGGKCVEEIDEPTFEQILDAIKRHTGVDLKPKLTKRQEINELKEAVAELTKTVETLVDNQNSMNDDVARVHQIATYNKVKIDRMNMSPIENKPRFKVGEWVESTVVKDGVPAGTKLLVFLSKNSTGSYCCSTGEGWNFYNDTELKHLNKEV